MISEQVQAERSFLGVLDPALCTIYFQWSSAYKNSDLLLLTFQEKLW